MSQTVKFTRIEDILYPEVLRGFPDRDEAISMTQEMLEANLIAMNTGWYEVVTHWYEIGEGESGMDTFFADEQLLEWEENGEFIEKVEAAGYNVEHIEAQTVEVIAEEVIEDDDDDDYEWDEFGDCDGECLGCERACGSRIPLEEDE